MILCIVLVKDWKERKIPDRYPALLAALGCIQIVMQELPGMSERIWGALAVSGMMLLITVLRPGAFGGGDIKLMAAGGLILGIRDAFYAAWISLLAAGVYCLCLVGTKKGSGKSTVALGPFLVIGMLCRIWT